MKPSLYGRSTAPGRLVHSPPIGSDDTSTVCNISAIPVHWRTISLLITLGVTSVKLRRSISAAPGIDTVTVWLQTLLLPLHRSVTVHVRVATKPQPFVPGAFVTVTFKL